MGKIGIVIPTIFSRPEYLPLAMESVRKAGTCHLAISAPNIRNRIQNEFQSRFACEPDQLIEDTPGVGLAQKINDALNALPADCEYIGWLGDDDLLRPKALEIAAAYLDEHPECVMVYGGCDYIDAQGNLIFKNPSSQLASSILHFGPQLIPQPGSLWRRDAFEKVGGLSTQFDMAFDFDLFLKLKRVGDLRHVPITLASFRWHKDSLSVKKRWRSVSEASKVRRTHYSGIARLLWPMWEPWVVLSTWAAGKLASLSLYRH